MVVENTDTYQRCCNVKPGIRETTNAMAAKVTSRSALLITDGTVLPSAWKRPEQVKISPDATKFHEMVRRKSRPPRRWSRRWRRGE